MAANSPTILITPSDPSELAPASNAMQIGLITAGILLIVLALFAIMHRRTRKMDPRELAFRTLSTKLGYSRQQIKKLRSASLDLGLTSPVGLVMSPSLSERVLETVSKRAD